MLKQIVPNITPTQMLYVLGNGDISFLEGQILTYLDAILGDLEQRKAAKDIIRPLIWRWAIEQNIVSQYEMKLRVVSEK